MTGMDTRRRLQKATRFFARPIAFDLECPHCGDVYTVRPGTARRKSVRDPNWDPWTARFRCTNKECGRTYLIGLLAWPIVAAPNAASAPPADQVPHERQLVALRKEGGGWWLPKEERQRYPRPHETNLTTEEERPHHDDDDE
jgi:hypothetical protein